MIMNPRISQALKHRRNVTLAKYKYTVEISYREAMRDKELLEDPRFEIFMSQGLTKKKAIKKLLMSQFIVNKTHRLYAERAGLL